MTWRIVRQAPPRGDKPAQDIPAGSNIFARERADELAARFEEWAADFDGAKFVVVEEEEKKSDE